jgi:hypothetical protein
MQTHNMTNGFIPESSLLLGIIPALILLYYSIKEWQGKFTEKTLFIMFVIGIISGFIVAIIQSQISFTIELLILYPFLEQIVKTMILNLKRYQEKQETIIYGLGLGLGFGSIYPPASLILLQDGITATSDLLFILLGSIGLVFLHGVTGAIIGYGIYQGKLPKYYLYAVGILIIANIIRLEYMLQWINLVLGIGLFWYIYRKIIKTIGTIAERRKRVNKTQNNE